MAVDKLVDSTQLDANLTTIANAIRAKGGTSASLAFPAGFVSAVEAIPTGSAVTGYGNPYTMMMHGYGTYTVDGTSGVVAWDTYANNTNNSRRCLAAISGEHEIKRRTAENSYSSGTGIYPIAIPTGTSSVSIVSDVTGQAIVFFATYNNDWISNANTGWVNLPILNYALPSGATHICICLRVNTSNAAFAATTQPKYVNISFQ